MKKIVLAVLASTTAFTAAPAAAQDATGTVNVTGVVAGRCTVMTGGTSSTSFTGKIDLQRLDADDGTLRSNLAASTPADNVTVPARVVCTSAKPTVGIAATKLNTGGAIDPGTGYSNDIDYTALLKVKTAGSATATEVRYTTDQHTQMVTQQLPGRLAASGDNIEVSISSLRAEGGTSSVLNAGTYNSTVNVLIQPTL